MNSLRKLLLKKLLKHHEDRLNIFMLKQSTLSNLSENLAPSIKRQISELPLNCYLNVSELHSALKQANLVSPLKETIFKASLDPIRLFNLEFQKTNSAEMGPIRTIVDSICRQYKIREIDREDWMQQICLRLSEDQYSRLRSFEGASSFMTFLVTLVQRACIDEMRLQWGRKILPDTLKDKGELFKRLYVLLYWDAKNIAEASELLKLEGWQARGQIVEKDWESEIQKMAQELMKMCDHFPKTDARKQLREALSSGEAKPASEFQNETESLLESLAIPQWNPEETLLFKDSRQQLMDDLKEADCLRMYVLTEDNLAVIQQTLKQPPLKVSLQAMLYEEFFHKKEFLGRVNSLHPFKRNSREEELLLKVCCIVPPRFQFMINRALAGVSLAEISREIDMPLKMLYLRIKKLKIEMASKGWHQETVNLIFRR